MIDFAYSFRRFSAFALYLISHAAALIAKKNRLNIKCVPHDICLSTPPQEQGTLFPNPSRTNVIYPVNRPISNDDNKRPCVCHLSDISIPTTVHSAKGTSIHRMSATAGGNNWLCISWREATGAAILLIAAYVNSKMSSAGARVFTIRFIGRQSKVVGESKNSGKRVVYPLEGGRNDYL